MATDRTVRWTMLTGAARVSDQLSGSRAEAGMESWTVRLLHGAPRRDVAASMNRPGFFSRPVNLQQSMLGINDRLVRMDAAVGPN